MATYVTSDAHGHVRALDQALSLAQPGRDDAVYVLGDMVDRGPDPVGVVNLVRSLQNAVVLAGNHEMLMLEGMRAADARDKAGWQFNGGFATSEQLERMPQELVIDLLEWVENLPTFAVVTAQEQRASMVAGTTRAYILTHAGIDAPRLRANLAEMSIAAGAHGGYGNVGARELAVAMGGQDAEDLQWIRQGFWDVPTGLVGRDGRGPVVVAGHTPSISLARFSKLMCGAGIDEKERGVVVEVGPSRDTGGVPDRVCIDCSAAAGFPNGRVGVMRLEDRRVWYADVNEGE
ncbi:MAG: metallophosphoesterase [Coriobacteriaceae bacterium]|nr:metallophosphoesterase [Coriobacteriaceae bacterium]